MDRNQSRKTAPSNVQKANQRKLILAAIVILIVAVIGIILLIRKYMPTTERMDLTEYYTLTEENQAAVILNGTYCEPDKEDAGIYARYEDGEVYLELAFLKDKLDNGYVYDNTENTLRYATDKDVITATLGSGDYMVNKTKSTLGHNVLLSENGDIFVAIDFVKQYTDIGYSIQEAPARVVIEQAGYQKKTATIKKDTQMRRYGGVKSKILKDASKGDKVSIIENYGKWSLVLSEDGVLGCVKNRALTDKQDETVAAALEERSYQHQLLDKEINMAWHQVTTAGANSTLSGLLSTTKGINVISPTWFALKDNKGNISNIASSDYVSFCHNNGIQVWGLVSNLVAKDVDTAAVLNTTSTRDNVVNALIAAAITYDLDGINVDIEELSGSAADGYIQFIKELSIKCENNGLVLSVDNYAPSASSMHYDRTTQAQYADYVVIMAYDEHYAGGNEAGSVASIGFVQDAVADTLKEVPANQVIMGMPFYARVWITSADGLSSQAMGMDAISKLIADNNATTTWSEECGQNYAEYTKNDKTYQIWVEDAASMEEKLKVIDDNKLAGGAFWKLGFDNSGIWNTITKHLNK